MKFTKQTHILLSLLITLMLSGCLDNQGAKVTQECSSEEECKFVNKDPSISFCEFHKTVQTYNGIQGDGSSSNPFLICNPGQLFSITQNPFALNHSYRLMRDIDLADFYLAGNPFFQIGSCGQTSCSTLGPGHVQYNGIFDGNGYRIKNFTFLSDTKSGVALFGSISSTGVVQNLKIEDPDIRGLNATGAVAGRNDGTVKNVDVIGQFAQIDVATGGTYLGGLVGINNGLLDDGQVLNDVVSVIDVQGKNSRFTGGLVGYNSGRIIRSINHANVAHDSSGEIGGIAGINTGVITLCVNHGVISGDGDFIGGLVGVMNHEATISQSYNDNTVEGEAGSNNVGGIAGAITFPSYNDISKSNSETRGNIVDSYNTGNVSSATGDRVGGITGHNQGKITSAYNMGNVTGQNDVGGICGLNDYIIAQSFPFSITITSVADAGFIFGDSSADDAANGIAPAPIWDGSTKTLNDMDDTRYPYNVYHNVTCAGCNTDGGIVHNTSSSYGNPDMRVYAESYVKQCPGGISNTFCIQGSIDKIIHWDFNSIWKSVNNAPPSLRNAP